MPNTAVEGIFCWFRVHSLRLLYVVVVVDVMMMINDCISESELVITTNTALYYRMNNVTGQQ